MSANTIIRTGHLSKMILFFMLFMTCVNRCPAADIHTVIEQVKRTACEEERCRLLTEFKESYIQAMSDKERDRARELARMDSEYISGSLGWRYISKTVLKCHIDDEQEIVTIESRETSAAFQPFSLPFAEKDARLERLIERFVEESISEPHQFICANGLTTVMNEIINYRKLEPSKTLDEICGNWYVANYLIIEEVCVGAQRYWLFKPRVPFLFNFTPFKLLYHSHVLLSSCEF